MKTIGLIALRALFLSGCSSFAGRQYGFKSPTRITRDVEENVCWITAPNKIMKILN